MRREAAHAAAWARVHDAAPPGVEPAVATAVSSCYRLAVGCFERTVRLSWPGVHFFLKGVNGVVLTRLGNFVAVVFSVCSQAGVR